MHADNDVYGVHVPFMCHTDNRMELCFVHMHKLSDAECNVAYLDFPTELLQCWQACNAKTGAVVQTEAHLNMHV